MARGVMELLEEINEQGTTIVMVTHDPELAARAQRNVHIVDGKVTDSTRVRAWRCCGAATSAGAVAAVGSLRRIATMIQYYLKLAA
jgi:putative ABC transport system ATP-binding protein